MATQEQLDADTQKYIEENEKRLGRSLTDWEKHKIADWVYFDTLFKEQDCAPGPPGEDQ